MTTATLAPPFYDLGSAGVGTTTIDLTRGSFFRLTCTAGTRTIGAPNCGTRADGSLIPLANPSGPLDVGQFIHLEIRATGGALTLTWDALFKGGPTSIANGQRRIIPLVFDGVSLVVVNAGADVPN